MRKNKKIIQDIEGIGFQCEAGYLSSLVAWQELKREIKELEDIGIVELSRVDTRPKNHIEKMKEEAKELEEKIKKLKFSYRKKWKRKNIPMNTKDNY